MGGAAFSAHLPLSAFPRIPPVAYEALKARLLPKLEELYTCVGIPVEAPGKVDYGDLDFLVALPKPPHTDYVPHMSIMEAIGANHVIPMEGNRTSNYAIPVQQAGELQVVDDGESEQTFYQVDVHVCMDKNEWDRIMFYHSYGDLGMILGLIARNNGLKLGVNGLQVVDSPNPPFHLSDSFDDITQFLGLSMDSYNIGFQTKRDIFAWVVTSKYFNPFDFRTSGPGIKKVKPDRRMYAEFVEWVEESRSLEYTPFTEMKLPLVRTQRLAQVREEALTFFNKKESFEDIVRERTNRRRLKDSFTGSHVRDWAGLGGNWRGVKLIMDEIRRRVGGDEEILQVLDRHGQDKLRDLVLQVKVDLNLKTAS